MCDKRGSSEVSPLLKLLMFLFNAVFWFAGVLLIGVGAWAFAEKNRLALDGLDSLQAKYNDVFHIVFDLTIVVVVLGMIIFVLAFVGCLGALRENICLLKCFSYILFVLLLMEIVLAILAFVFSKDVKARVVHILQMEALVHYRDDDDLRNLIDWTQKTFHCCGVGPHGYLDWSYNLYFNCSKNNPSVERCSVPYSCCVSPNDINVEYINTMCGQQVQDLSENAARERIYTTGCVQQILGLAEQNLFVIGGVALGLAVLQLLGVCLAHVLAGQIADQRARWT